jgi:hypothetical protein
VHHPYRSAIQSCCLSTRVALARLAPPPGGYRRRALADRGTAYSVRRARSLPCSEHVIFDQVEFGERRESPEDLVGRASEDVWRGKGVEQEAAGRTTGSMPRLPSIAKSSKPGRLRRMAVSSLASSSARFGAVMSKSCHASRSAQPCGGGKRSARRQSESWQVLSVISPGLRRKDGLLLARPGCASTGFSPQTVVRGLSI